MVRRVRGGRGVDVLAEEEWWAGDEDHAGNHEEGDHRPGVQFVNQFRTEFVDKALAGPQMYFVTFLFVAFFVKKIKIP
jgi:hypothetical protein